MESLETVIDQLSEDAKQADLTSLFATSHETRLYNADLARELRDIITALKNELDRREGRITKTMAVQLRVGSSNGDNTSERSHPRSG